MQNTDTAAYRSRYLHAITLPRLAETASRQQPADRDTYLQRRRRRRSRRNAQNLQLADKNNSRYNGLSLLGCI